MQYTLAMEILESARMHGVSADAIRHAVANNWISFPVSLHALPDHEAVGYVGPDLNADPIEVFTFLDEDGEQIAIHAMKARAQFLDLL